MNNLPSGSNASTQPAAPTAPDALPEIPLLRFALLAAGYFALGAILRVLFSHVAELDETEQLITTQTWALGYGPQPPLYDWFQRAVFQLTGPGITGLAVMKALVLATLACALYHAFRCTLRPPSLAAPAACLLVWMPEWIWMSQIDRTHTLLASVGFTLAFAEFLRLASDPRPIRYIRLGLYFSLTFLSKYNAAAFLLLLLLTALALPRTRQRLLHPLALLTLAFACIPVIPHVLWLSEHLHQIADKARTYHNPESASRLAQLIAGFAGFFGALALALIPPSIAIALVTRSTSPPRSPSIPPQPVAVAFSDPSLIPLLQRYFALVVAIACAAPVFFHIHRIRHHWFQPLFVLIPLGLFAATSSRWTPASLRALVRWSACIACAVALVIPFHPLLAPIRKKPFRQNTPFPQIAAALGTNLTEARVVLADNRWIAGNLRIHHPHARYSAPELSESFRPPSPPFLLVWNATRNPLPPPLFVRHVQELGYAFPDPQHFDYREAPFGLLPSASPMRLGFVRVTGAAVPPQPR